MCILPVGKLSHRLPTDFHGIPFRSRRDKIRIHSSRFETSASKITLFFSSWQNCIEIFRVSNRWEHLYCIWCLSWQFSFNYLFWIRAVGTFAVWVGRGSLWNILLLLFALFSCKCMLLDLFALNLGFMDLGSQQM